MNVKEQLSWQIVGAYRLGCHKAAISAALNVPYSTICQVVQSYTRRGTVARQRGFGCPRKTTPRSDRLLVRLAKAHRFTPAPLQRGA